MERVPRDVAPVIAGLALALASPSRAQSPALRAPSSPHGGEVREIAGKRQHVRFRYPAHD